MYGILNIKQNWLKLLKYLNFNVTKDEQSIKDKISKINEIHTDFTWISN